MPIRGKRKKFQFMSKARRLPDGFNEASYLAANQDVASAVERGTVESGAAHWRTSGYLEGRPLEPMFEHYPELPQEFDEQSYLDLNPDVKANVASGGFLSGAEHFRFKGFKENRKLRQDVPVVVAEPETVTMEEAARSTKPDPLDYGRANPDILNAIGFRPDDLRDHWALHGFKEGRSPFGLTTFHTRSFSHRYWSRADTFTFYGMLEASTGLGRAARHYVSMIRAAGYNVNIVSLKIMEQLFESKPPTRLLEQSNSLREMSKVNIFHLNADVVHLFFADDRQYLLNDAYNIGIWVWELAHFRPEWTDACGAFDEIWVPSEFCRAAIAAVVPVPVYVMPHAVVVEPTLIEDPRNHFRIPKDAFVFGAYFDVGSGIDRKNPSAVIEAFRAAFGDSREELLILKYHSSHHDSSGIKQIHALCEGLNNVRFIGYVLSEDEVSALRCVVDCFVSAHRSEGFGLNVAEAIASGIPVIATLYSGIEDFCDSDSIYPIAYHLTELKSWFGPYPKDGLWAEPSLTSLSNQMLHVRRNLAEATEKASLAKHRLLQNNNLDVLAAKIKARVDELELFKPAPVFFKSVGKSKEAASRFSCYEDIRFSVIVPVFNIAPDLLAKCIMSVRNQTYQNWELILFDDGSDREDTIEALQMMRGVDPRIKVAFAQHNRGIAAATHEAIGFSSGSFLAFLDNDDELASRALQSVASAIQRDPDADVLYSDEDKLSPVGRRCDHYFKPDWSPEHLESVMYLLHFFVVRRSLYLQVGGLREEFSGAQDYDLALRMTRVARKVVHIPEILYHWRMIQGSASMEINAKPKALERARLALEDHCRALGRPAHVTANPDTGLLRVQDFIEPGLPVTLLILTDNRFGDVQGRGRFNLLDNFIESIVKKTETKCAIRYLVVDNDNLTSTQVKRITALGGKVVHYSGTMKPFNFSSKANFALRQVETEIVVMLNDDLEVITPDWIDALVGLAQRPTSGIVGAKLRFPNETIQHCGIVMGINDHVAHVYHQYPVANIGYNGFTHVIRNHLAVTGACMAARMSCLIEVGLFDESLRIDYNDIDLCLKLHSAGYRNIFTPYAELYHFEGSSQSRKEPTPADRKVFNQRWGHYLNADPFYNPNLTRHELDFRAAEPATWA